MSVETPNPWCVTLESRSAEETLEIGRQIGAVLRGGDQVTLVGPLGAGKTQLAKGLAVGMGVADPQQVNSPTFVLVNEYDGRLHIYHLDCYRLSGAAELASLGFEEMCDDRSVVMIEWADRVAEAMGPDALWAELSPTGATERRLRLHTRSAGLARRLATAGLDPQG